MHLLRSHRSGPRLARGLLSLLLAVLAGPVLAQIAVTPALPTPQSTLSVAALPPAVS